MSIWRGIIEIWSRIMAIWRGLIPLSLESDDAYQESGEQ